MSFTTNDKLIIRKLFQLEIYRKSGKEFEDFFCKILRYKNKNFESVKPQGQIGDRKNDGFIKEEGIYYQVYAPENLFTKESATISKLQSDFKGLHAYWNDLHPIKEFVYVLNDRYGGAYPSVHLELSKIESTYSPIKCSTLTTNKLEDIFLSLSDDEITDIVGNVPTPENIDIDFSVLNEIITYICNLETPFVPETIPVRPDFNDKLMFNNLNTEVSNLLRSSSYLEGSISEYFKVNGTFVKDELRNKFSGLYQLGLSEFGEEIESRNDLIFFYILDNACEKKNFSYQSSILVLMAYYFGFCDIFEEPLI